MGLTITCVTQSTRNYFLQLTRETDLILGEDD